LGLGPTAAARDVMVGPVIGAQAPVAYVTGRSGRGACLVAPGLPLVVESLSCLFATEEFIKSGRTSFSSGAPSAWANGRVTPIRAMTRATVKQPGPLDQRRRAGGPLPSSLGQFGERLLLAVRNPSRTPAIDPEEPLTRTLALTSKVIEADIRATARSTGASFCGSGMLCT